VNEYEAGTRKNIPAVLVYLSRGEHFLMLHRNSAERPDDFHTGKWNGLGGKCEADESYLQAARRETLEESGVTLSEDQLRFCGFIQFPNFKPKKAEDWSVMVFHAELAEEQVACVVHTAGEGSLHWIARDQLLALNLWPGDREFLPKLLVAERFIGTIWYRADGAVDRSEWQD
jgi:8-oxo-dGTP diphosphatase